MEAHGVLDLAAAVEMSGSHYETVKRVLSKHWTVRMIHPFTTKQLRQPASPGVKTDDADLDAMTRAMISGYSYEEAELPPFYEEWRMFCRNRIDYVEERVQIMQRCMERIEANMPGITTVFKDIWKRKGVLAVVRYLGGARKILDAGEDGIRKMLRERKVKMASSTIFKILAWAENAAEPASQAKTRRRLIRDDFEMIDRHDKKIREYEFELLRFFGQKHRLGLYRYSRNQRGVRVQLRLRTWPRHPLRQSKKNHGGSGHISLLFPKWRS
jgi:hypothetical protein